MVRRLTRTIHTPIPAITPEWDWRGARLDLRWEPGRAAPGAIVIGAAAMCTSITTTISIAITLTISTAETGIRLTGAAVTAGSTILLIVAMRPTAIEERLTDSAKATVAVRAIAAVSAVAAALVEAEEVGVRAEWVAQVVPGELAERVAPAVPVELE